MKKWTPIVDFVKESFGGSVYSCNGQPCLKFETYERLNSISEFVKRYGYELNDVFYMVTQE